MSIKFLLLGLGLAQAAGTHVITCNLSETALHNEIRSQECALQYTGGGDNVQISEIFNGEKNSKRMLLPQTFYSTHIATSKPYLHNDMPPQPLEATASQENETKLSSLPDIIYFSDAPEPYQTSTQYIYKSGFNQVTYCTPMGCSTLVGRTNIKTQYCIIGDKDTVKCSCKNPLPIGFLPGENVLGAICLSSEYDHNFNGKPVMELYYISPVPLSGVAEFHYREGHYDFFGSWNKKVLSPEGTILTSESSMNPQVGEEEEEKEGDDDSGEYILTFYDRNKAAGRIEIFFKYNLSQHLGKDINTFAISHNLHPMADFTSSLYAVRTQNNLFLVNEKKQEAEEERKEGEKKELYLSKVPEALWPLYEGENEGGNAVREKGPRIVIQSFRQEKMNPFTMGEGGKYGYINKAVSISPIDLAIPMTGARVLRDKQEDEWKEELDGHLRKQSEQLEEFLTEALRLWVENKEKEHRDAIIAIAQGLVLSSGLLKGRFLADLALLDKIPLKDLTSSAPVIRQRTQQAEEGNEMREENLDINYPEVLELVVKEVMKEMKEKAKDYLFRIEFAASKKNRGERKGYRKSWEEEDPAIRYVKNEVNEWVDTQGKEKVEKVIDDRITLLFFKGGMEFYDIGVEERNARANGHVRWGDKERKEWIKKKYPTEEKKKTASPVVEKEKEPKPLKSPEKTLSPVVVKRKDYDSESSYEEGKEEKETGLPMKTIMVAFAVVLLALGSFAIYSHKKSKQEKDPFLQNNSRFI